MTPTPSDCRQAKVPPLGKLNFEQHAGRACFACGKPLMYGAISCGRAVDQVGARVIDVEVWACP